MARSVVTGASSGIGFATALKFASEGHEVHASVRSLASGNALLEAADGLDLSLMVMDVDDDDAVAQAFSKLHTEHGAVDVLVNNAGVAGGGSIESTPIADFKRVMNTNTWGTVRCIQAVLPTMRERRAGHIINVTSLAGRVVQGSQGIYVASKFAAEAITEVLAMETRPFGIRVTAIEPGVIKTPIFTKGSGSRNAGSGEIDPYVGSRRMSEVFSSSLRGTPGTPAMVADAIWQAFSDDATPLRVLVGNDAHNLVENRAAMSDEAWIAGHANPDDADFRTWIGDLSGITVSALPD